MSFFETAGRILKLALAAFILLSSSAFAQRAGFFTDHPDGSRTLLKHVPREVAQGRAKMISPVNPNQNLDLRVILPSKDPVGLDHFITALYDPKSPAYHQFLTPQQFALQFGASAVDSALVIQKLKSQGLNVVSQSKNGFVLRVTGRVSTVGAAFKVNINNYRASDGKTFFAPDADPTIPVQLAGKITAIAGMDNKQRFHPHIIKKNIMARNVAVSTIPAVNPATVQAAPVAAAPVTVRVMGNSISKISLKPRTNPPAAPAYLTAIPSNCRVYLYWAPVSSATSYNVYRSTSLSGTYTQVQQGSLVTNGTDDPPGTCPSAFSYGTVDGTTYYYYVTAVGSGESVASAKVSVTPFAFTGFNGSAGPGDLASIYGLGSVPSSGSGQTLGLVELDGFVPDDTTAFVSNYKDFFSPYLGPGPTYTLPVSTVCVDVLDSGNHPTCPINSTSNPAIGAGNTEVTSDIDVMLAAAPGIANIQVFEAPNTSAGWIDIWNVIAGNDSASDGNKYLPHVVSASWGSHEDNSSGVLNGYDHAVFQQLASQGQSVFSASGDAGAYDVCDGGTNPPDCYVGGVPAQLTEALFEFLFPNPPVGNAYNYATAIMGTLQGSANGYTYLDSNGYVPLSLDLTTQAVQTDIISKFPDGPEGGTSPFGAYSEAEIIYNILLRAQTAESQNTRTSGPTVDDPASDPYVTGVGISLLSPAVSGGVSTGAYSGELASYYGGGGISSYWPISNTSVTPAYSYQLPAATGYYNATSHAFGSTTMRNVPDVSLNADPATPYGIYLTDTSNPAKNNWQGISGSSLAAPIWAAFIARVNQGRLAQGLSYVGFLNPAIYQIAQSSNYANDFHTISSGINNNYQYFAGNDYYPAKAGYNPIAGLGSFNAPNLYSDLLKPAAPTSLMASVNSGTVILSWTASTASNVSYNVYRSGTSGSGYSKIATVAVGNGTGYVDSAVTLGSTYYYVVRAVNVLSVEGANSNEATATLTAYSLGITATNGSVQKAVNGQSTSATSFAPGTVVTLTATADQNYALTGWIVNPSGEASSDCSGTTGTCTVTLNAATTVTATFAIGYSLSITSSHGNVVKTVNGQTTGLTSFVSGTVVALSATADQGYVLTGWTVNPSGEGAGDCSGTTGTCTVTVNAATTVTANYSQVYSLGITAANGSVTKTVNAQLTSATSFVPGTVVTLTATADQGFALTGWAVHPSAEGASDCSGITGTCTVTVNAATTVTANFLPVYNLGITAPNGSVAKAVNGQSTVATSFTSGTVVTLTATANQNFGLAGWTVSPSAEGGSDCSGVTGTCTVTVSADTTVTANFAPLYALGITATNGSVTKAVGGQSTVATSFTSGTVVTLTALADQNYAFTGWTVNPSPEGGSDCSGESGTCTVTMTAATTVTANFAPGYSLGITAVNGTVTKTVNSQLTGLTSFVAGTTVTLTATADQGYALTGWTVNPSAEGASDCSGITGTCTVTVNAATSATANFSPVYTLGITAPNGAVTKTVNSQLTGLTSFVAGTVVTLTATANQGYALTGWTVNPSAEGASDCSGITGTCTVTVNAATTVTAVFAPLYSLGITATNGTVTKTVNGQLTGLSSFLSGTVVTLTATADQNYAFTGWTVNPSAEGGSDCSGATGTCTVTVSAATTVTANFLPVYAFNITAPNGSVGESVNGQATSAASFVSGTVVTLTATADQGYGLAGWTVEPSSEGAVNCSGRTGTCTVTVSAATTVTANFSLMYSLGITAVNGSVIKAVNGQATGLASFLSGTVVTLTATANFGYAFSGWVVDPSAEGALNCSGLTGACTVTVNAATSVTAHFTLIPVAAPTNFNASILAARVAGHMIYGGVSLTWAQSTSAGVIRNNIYRATGAGPYALLTSVSPALSYTDKGMTRGVTYHYEVTAVTGSGESGPSDAVTVAY